MLVTLLITVGVFAILFLGIRYLPAEMQNILRIVLVIAFVIVMIGILTGKNYLGIP